MNDMQRDYLIGLIQHKYDQLGISELDSFIETYGVDYDLMDQVNTFLDGDQTSFSEGLLSLEKVEDKVNVKSKVGDFTINKSDFDKIIDACSSFLYEYYPLGTIVKVDDQYVMIEQRMVKLSNSDSYHDYRGVPYPTGIFNNSMYVYFDRDAIVELLFLGYKDAEGEGFELAMKEDLLNKNVFSLKYSK